MLFILNVMSLILVARIVQGLYYFGSEINRPVPALVQIPDV